MLPAGSIIIGMDAGGQPIGLPLRTRLEHCLVVGDSGVGKSRLLLHFLRQLFAYGEGFMAVDPHGAASGSLYRSSVTWFGARDAPLHLIDLDEPATLGCNFLRCPEGVQPSVIVGNVMEALAIISHVESFAQTPTIQRVLPAVLTALVELKLSLPQAEDLLKRDDPKGLRSYAIQHMQDDHMRDILKRIDELALRRNDRDYEIETIGAKNRLEPLLSQPVMRDILGRDGIDFHAAIEQGEIILANLSGESLVSKQASRIFGALLTRTMFFEATRRRSRIPFSFIIDEAADYLTPDIPRLLAQVRKFGVSVIPVIQWLAQAKDPEMLAALFNINAKICFRLKHPDEAELMVRAMMPLDREEPVQVLIKPTIVGYDRVQLSSESEGQNQSAGTTASRSLMNGKATTDADTAGHAVTDGTHDAESDSVGEHEGSHEGASINTTDIAIPVKEDGIFAPEATILRTASGEGTSTGADKGTDHSHVTSQGSSHLETDSLAHTHAETASSAETVQEGSSETHGTSLSKGQHEALLPILKNLPTAVHSLQNQIYKAARMLLTQPTGVAYVSYASDQAVNTFFVVPPVYVETLPKELFCAVRAALLPPMPAVLAWTPPRAAGNVVVTPITEAKHDRGARGW